MNTLRLILGEGKNLKQTSNQKCHEEKKAWEQRNSFSLAQSIYIYFVSKKEDRCVYVSIRFMKTNDLGLMTRTEFVIPKTTAGSNFDNDQKRYVYKY